MNESLKNAALEVLNKVDRREEIDDYDLAILKTAILARTKECKEKRRKQESESRGINKR